MRNSPTVSQLFVAPLRNKPLKRRRFRHEKRLPESSGSPTGGEYEIPQQLSSNPVIAIIPRVMGSVTHALSKFSTPDSTKIRFKQICAGDRSQATQKQIGAKRRAFGTAASLLSCCSMRVFFYLRQWTDTMTSSHRNPYFSRKVYLRRCRCVIRKTTSLVHKPIMGHAPAPYFRTSTMDSARTHLAVPIISAKVLFKPVASSTE